MSGLYPGCTQFATTLSRKVEIKEQIAKWNINMISLRLANTSG